LSGTDHLILKEHLDGLGTPASVPWRKRSSDHTFRVLEPFTRLEISVWCGAHGAGRRNMSAWWELIVFVVLVAIVSGGGTLLVTSVVNKPSRARDASIQSEATSQIAGGRTADLDDTPSKRRAA
jgi:hypothetical protein